MKRVMGLTCPRCLGQIPNDEMPGAYPGALSRTDNETEICSNCGTEEGFEQFPFRGNREDKQGLTSQSQWPVRCCPMRETIRSLLRSESLT